MNKQQALIEALESIVSLIRVSVDGPQDGDLYAGLPDGMTDEDLAKFNEACLEIATSLAARQGKLLASEREKRKRTKPRYKEGNWYELRWKREEVLRAVNIYSAEWTGSDTGWRYGGQDDRRQRYGFYESEVTEEK